MRLRKKNMVYFKRVLHSSPLNKFCVTHIAPSLNNTLRHVLRVHNRVLRSRVPAHFSLLIPPSRPSFHRNPDPAVIFNKAILIKIKTYQYSMGSKYGTITTRKRAQSRFLLFAFKLFSEFEDFRFHFPYWHVPKLRMSLLCSFIPIFH